MLAYMNDASNPQNAYPAFWAPFEIVAEGATKANPVNLRSLSRRSGHWAAIGSGRLRRP